MQRGEIWRVSANSSKHEAVMVLSPKIFNERTGTPMVVPIDTGNDLPRVNGFSVTLSGRETKTRGVALCHRTRPLDLSACDAIKEETAPEWFVDAVLETVGCLFE
jgi:mRNA-degrading endonuclease toxin of MazEF toxin-antitoxin module